MCRQTVARQTTAWQADDGAADGRITPKQGLKRMVRDVTAEYRSRLVSADVAVEGIASGAQVAMGMAIGQPPALLAALAAADPAAAAAALRKPSLRLSGGKANRGKRNRLTNLPTISAHFSAKCFPENRMRQRWDESSSFKTSFSGTISSLSG